jgi:hypothetical protein
VLMPDPGSVAGIGVGLMAPAQELLVVPLMNFLDGQICQGNGLLQRYFVGSLISVSEVCLELTEVSVCFI